MSTKIEWTDETWQPVVGCSKVSIGCAECYAERMAYRLACMGQKKYQAVISTDGGVWNGKIFCDESVLDKPLHWKKPRMIFVCSMSDLFHPSVPFEFIDKVMAVIALCPQHQFQLLSKRPEIALKYFTDKATPFRIAKQKDIMSVRQQMRITKKEIRKISGYEKYYISNEGIVYSDFGSATCVNCGNDITAFAKSKFCCNKCKHHARYILAKTGKYPLPPSLSPMSPLVSSDGYSRVTLYGNATGYRGRRELVHRLVLTEFVRPPIEKEQTCHKDGNPQNNHIENLRWGSQSDNWAR